MSPDEAPVNTICCVGHPGNGILVRRTEAGWVYVHNGEILLDVDTIYKALRALWVPGYETIIKEVK